MARRVNGGRGRGEPGRVRPLVSRLEDGEAADRRRGQDGREARG